MLFGLFYPVSLVTITKFVMTLSKFTAPFSMSATSLETVRIEFKEEGLPGLNVAMSKSGRGV